jgi:Primase C terminal 1 (PriCT-1)
MNAYRALFRSQLTEIPKKQMDKQFQGYDSEHGWVFISKDCKSFKATRTYHTLFSLSTDANYFTPNTFYRNDQRHEGALRWLNAFVIDIDVKNGDNEKLTLPEVQDRITEAGLPLPSLIVQTPSGGYHIYYYLNVAKKAFPSVIRHYKAIQREMAVQLGGDLQAIGAERWFRIPTEDNILYQSKERQNFHFFADWLSIQQEERVQTKSVSIGQGGLLQHPAIVRLLGGAERGKRDHTCYTLALTFKVEGYSKEEAETRLREWNCRLEEPMTLLEVKRKVKSAYKADAKRGPSAEWIRQLSGLPFSYRPLEGAKPREERTYSHYEEWEEDIIRHLEQNGGSLCAAQRQIASAIGMSFSSFKDVLKRLVDTNRINLTVQGRGRGARTTITLVEEKVVSLSSPSSQKTNGPNSYTLKDQVVGGSSLSALLGLIPSLSLGDLQQLYFELCLEYGSVSIPVLGRMLQSIDLDYYATRNTLFQELLFAYERYYRWFGEAFSNSS